MRSPCRRMHSVTGRPLTSVPLLLPRSFNQILIAVAPYDAMAAGGGTAIDADRGGNVAANHRFFVP